MDASTVRHEGPGEARPVFPDLELRLRLEIVAPEVPVLFGAGELPAIGDAGEPYREIDRILGVRRLGVRRLGVEAERVGGAALERQREGFEWDRARLDRPQDQRMFSELTTRNDIIFHLRLVGLELGGPAVRPEPVA